MNVKMPDGTIVENVPEGTTKAQLMVKLHAARNPLPKPEPTGMGERFLQGLADPIVGAAQLADKVIDPIRQAISPGAYSMNDVVRRRDADYVAPEGMDWARTAGNIANPINYMGGGAAATKAGAAVAASLPAALKTGLATAVGGGALQSALAPTEADQSLGDFAAAKAKQATIGGVSAGVMTKVLPKVLSATPFKPTENAAKLLKEGVDLTPGQAAGGIVNATEQKLASVPLAGDIIKKARSRALTDVQERAIERATGMKGIKTLDAADDAVSRLYHEVVPKLRPTKQAVLEVSDALDAALANPEMVDSNRKILEGLHTKLFSGTGDRYMQMSGEQLKHLDTELGALGRKYNKSVLPSDQTLADEIYNIQRAMRQSWGYHLAPDDMAKLAHANTAYRNLIPIHKAASAKAGEVASPRALQKAMARHAVTDVTRRSDDLINPAVDVLADTVPNSGTADRLLAAGLTGGGGLYAAPMTTIGTVAGTAAAYSRPGVRMLTGNTGPQRAAQRLVEGLDPRMTGAARKAFLAAIRSQQADNSDKE